MRGISKHCPCCSGSPLAPHPDLLPSDAERGVGPHDRMSAGDDARALDFVLEIYPLFETAGKGCRNGLSFGGSLGQPACPASRRGWVRERIRDRERRRVRVLLLKTLGIRDRERSEKTESRGGPSAGFVAFPQNTPIASRASLVAFEAGVGPKWIRGTTPTQNARPGGFQRRFRGFLGAVRPERGELAAERGRSGSLMVGEPGGGVPPHLVGGGQ